MKKIDILYSLLGKMIIEFQNFELCIDLICLQLIGGEDENIGRILIQSRNISEKLRLIVPLFDNLYPIPKWIEILEKYTKKCDKIVSKRNYYIHSNFYIDGSYINLFKGKRNSPIYELKGFNINELKDFLIELNKIKIEANSIMGDIMSFNGKGEIKYFPTKRKLVKPHLKNLLPPD